MAYQGAQSPNDRRAAFDIKRAIRDLSEQLTTAGITIDTTNPAVGANLYLNAGAGNDSNIWYEMDGVRYWRLHRDESSSNNFRIVRFVGDVSTDVPFEIQHSDGTVDFDNRVRFNERVELPNANDVDAGTNQYSFKIGDDALTNLRIDNNEIVVLNNGVGASLFLNGSGTNGNVETGGNFISGGWQRAGDGSEATPSHSFDTDGDSGMYKYSANAIGFATGGVAKWSIGAAGNLVARNGTVVRSSQANAASPSYSFDGDTDTGMYWHSANRLAFTAGGVGRVSIGTNVNFHGHDLDMAGGIITNLNEVYADLGSQTDPSYAFDSNADCGVYGGTDFVGLTSAGTWKIGCWGTYTRTNGQHRFDSGSAGSPTIAWTSDVNTGFYRPSADAITYTGNGIARIDMASGSARMTFKESGTQRPYLAGQYGGQRTFYLGYPDATDSGNVYFVGDDMNIELNASTSDREIRLEVGGAPKGALNNTGVYFQEAYDATTSGDTYVKVSSTGRLRRHSSSVKLKRDIEPIDRTLGKQVLKDLDFIWFRSASPTDDSRHGFFGSTAESAAEKAPWLGVYEYPRDCGCEPLKSKRQRRIWINAGSYPYEDEEGNEQIWEWDAHWRDEEVEDERIEHTCGLGTPIGFDYSGLTAITASITEEQEERIDALEAELAQLKQQIAGMAAGGRP